MDELVLVRPQIHNYSDLNLYIKDMVTFQKKSIKGYSVYNACKKLRRVSPALITLILQGKRKITLDRVDELSQLLMLNYVEKNYFKGAVGSQGMRSVVAEELGPPSSRRPVARRKEVSVSILSDWLNLYVKDCFQIRAVQKDPENIYKILANIASRKRIERSFRFLLREGHLRKTLIGEIKTEVPLTTTNSPVPSQKIRNFHKAALEIAKTAIEIVPPNQRYANATTVAVDEKGYEEVLELIKEFSEKLNSYIENQDREGTKLYQVLINISPTGGENKNG